jgi:hypothetical protein
MPIQRDLERSDFHTVGLIEELDDELLRNNRIRGARRSKMLRKPGRRSVTGRHVTWCRTSPRSRNSGQKPSP